MRYEARQIVERYARRTRAYHPLDPSVFMARQELERALIRWLRSTANLDVSTLSLLEIGCGEGGNLLQMLRLGLQPQNLSGNELLSERAEVARKILPALVSIDCGDALDIAGEESFDVVFQSLVFSSILDDNTQEMLAATMWRLAKPGGGILWYDFAYDNPANPDVRGIRKSRVRELFPDAKLSGSSLTLAPPVSRRVTRLAPWLYTVLNAIPLLRTHRLLWIRKP